MAEELRLEGFSVIEAGRADEALTYIKEGEQVDLVFSDIRCPARSTDCNRLKYSATNIPTVPSFSRLEMPRQDLSE
jgi:CheY-like chemotaxis protein